jgi:hypothetical protein
MDRDRGSAEGLEGEACRLDGSRIAIYPQKPAARQDPLQDLTGVPCRPEGRVDRDLARARLEQLYYFF